MNETLMSKATFSEICKIMKHKDGQIHECIQSVVRLSLLLFPGLMCKDFASAAALEAGMLNVDVKDVIENTISSIKTAFGAKQEDFTTRAQDAQIAHILIVFAAYFDSIKLYLPDANRAFEINSKDKFNLTKDSIEGYITHLKEQCNQPFSDDALELTDFWLFMPNPVEGLQASMDRLKTFYEILNSRFLDFVEQLSYIESIPGHKQDHFYSVMRNIPKLALENYQKQYYDLSASFPDFFVWATQKEHASIQHTIDVGFADISSKFANIAAESSVSAAQRALSVLHRKYENYIKGPVVSNSDMPLGDNDVRLPDIETCFIPQSFRALIYRENVTLGNTNKWVARYEIGAFIADTLRSPELGTKPMLILGDPGAGKTMLCHMLAAKILYNEYHVIILHLRNLNAESEIYEQINQELGKSLQGMPCSWGDIAYTNPDKPILLIFDGYDELLQASGKTYSNYLEKIAFFQEDTAKTYGTTVRSIVTSRVILIDKAQIPKGSVIVHLDKFDEGRIELWSKIWNQHNADYFARNNLEPFKVTPSSKALDLATQPLLLLMLALFDSNDNALRRHQDLSAVQLYNSLIRDFIIREQKKNLEFNKKAPDVQKFIVDQEIERISIAALGMYNRNELYIRSPQLQEDLRHLSTIKEQAELQDSDKLLGSFFFIHRSDSINTFECGEKRSCAYEFLHNTFGEFLTAYYTTLQTYELLTHILEAQQENNNLNMTDKVKWYACLAYTPLFHRPVVSEMISSWAPLFFQEKGMSTENTIEALNRLIDIEIPRIIHGEIDSTITSIVQRFRSENSYPELDSRTHLAVYSINLICLMALLLDGLPLSLLEKHDIHAWSKLRHIWRYAFNEDDLTKYAYCFHVQHHDNSRVLEHRISDLKQRLLYSSDYSPYEQFATHLALDEEFEYSALGMLYGFDYDTVKNGFQRQSIPGRAWLAMKTLIKQPDLFSPTIGNRELCILDNIFEYGMQEKDNGALVYGFLFLKFLTNPQNTFLSEGYEQQKYTNAGWLCYAYRQVSGMIDRGNYHTDKPVRIIILEILNQIPLDVDDCEIICDDLFPYKFKKDQYSQVELFHLSLLGQHIIDTYLDNCEPIPYHLLDSYIIRMADSLEMICRQQKESIQDGTIREVLKTTVLIMRHCNNENVYHLLMIYKDYLHRAANHEDFYLTTHHAALLIEALSLYHKGDDDGSRLATELMPFIIDSGMTAIDLFDCAPSSIDSLCELAQHFPHDIGIPYLDMLIDLVYHRAKSISFGTYKNLLAISKNFDCQKLYDALADQLG